MKKTLQYRRGDSDICLALTTLKPQHPWDIVPSLRFYRTMWSSDRSLASWHLQLGFLKWTVLDFDYRKQPHAEGTGG